MNNDVANYLDVLTSYIVVGFGWGTGLKAAGLVTSPWTLALSTGFWPASMTWWLAQVLAKVMS